jgi:hypothetical protein
MTVGGWGWGGGTKTDFFDDPGIAIGVLVFVSALLSIRVE